MITLGIPFRSSEDDSVITVVDYEQRDEVTYVVYVVQSRTNRVTTHTTPYTEFKAKYESTTDN